VTLSLWGRLSLFWADFRWGASCELRRPTFRKAWKSRDTWGKKERLASWCWRACFVLSRVVTPAWVEAAGIEPASRDESAISSTCVVVDLNFVRTTGQRHPEIQTSLKLNLTIRVSNMTDCDLELVTSSLGSPAKPISRGSLFLGSHCERVIFCK